VRHAIDDRQNRCFRTDRCSMASSSEYDFTASRMRSNGSPMVSARTARAGSEKSPCGLMTRSPSRANWAARAARTMNVTSGPALMRQAPKYPPSAPAPITKIRMRTSSSFVHGGSDEPGACDNPFVKPLARSIRGSGPLIADRATSQRH
jgi:hypothetical protein